MSSFRLGTAVRSTGIVYSSFRAHEMTQLSQTPCLCALYEPYPALAAVLACAFSPTSINDDLLRAKSTAFAWARCFYLVLLYYYPYESIRCFLGPLVDRPRRSKKIILVSCTQELTDDRDHGKGCTRYHQVIARGDSIGGVYECA